VLIVAETFPVGAAALHPDWPEARFIVAGLFESEPLIVGYLKALNAAFACRGRINWTYGTPAVRWNGGRITMIPADLAKCEQAIAGVVSLNMGCLLAFTNHRLEQADLAAPSCNRLLDAIAWRPDINGVIVTSELLSKYIAARYPALPQVASITKVTLENGRGNAAYYAELGRRFHRYVVHPDDCFDMRLLDQLDREKAEIILNENCLRECPIRAQHYDAIAVVQLTRARVNEISAGSSAQADAIAAAAAATRQAQVIDDQCLSLPMSRQFRHRRRNCNFTPSEVKRVYDMGFRLFKLQGRGDIMSVSIYLYDLVRYTLEPDVAAPLLLKVLTVDFNHLFVKSREAAGLPTGRTGA
jgi:hypothetical protein